MNMALKIERRGRKRKAGQRYPSGGLVREKPNPKGYFYALLDEPMAVYVLEVGSLVKVGRSANPQQRSKEVQIGNGSAVRLVWFNWLKDKDAIKLESEFHKRHRGTGSHSMGEWYYMTPATAISLIEQEIKRFDLFALPSELPRKAS